MSSATITLSLIAGGGLEMECRCADTIMIVSARISRAQSHYTRRALNHSTASRDPNDGRSSPFWLSHLV